MDDRLPIYLDCNATTPIEPSVREVMLAFFDEDIGNAGSRTHVYGTRCRRAVEHARETIGEMVGAKPEEVVFTSGATESNNLAILGLGRHGQAEGRRHIISTQIEHKAVLGPLEEMERRGFEVTLLAPTPGGYVEPEAVQEALRSDTLLVSVMHVNNETGVEQPLAEIAAVLGDHPVYFHVDAAQGFGKSLPALQQPRIDLMSLSAHKVYGPKGVGALVARRRRFKRPPLEPLIHGGGQERGLRSGTLPVPLIVGFGEAARLARTQHEERRQRCCAFRQQALRHLEPLKPRLHGDQERVLTHTLNFAIPGVDAEAAMVALKDLIAVSNGSSCTSANYKPSHVLLAMGLSEDQVAEAIRMSWCNSTPQPDWPVIVARLEDLG